MVRRLIPALFAGLLLAPPAWALGDISVPNMPTNPGVTGATQFYCPNGTTDFKCTAAQVAAFNYSLMSGDCSVTSEGVITCTGGTHLTGVPLATGVTGNLSVSHLAGGASASGTTFWRGDGTWATPAGGGGAVSSVASGDSNLTITPTTGAVVATLTNVPVNKMNGGTGASSTTFWRGDGTWQTPAGSGTVTGISTQCPTAGPISPVAGVVTLNNSIATTTVTTTPYTVQGTDCGSIVTFNSGSAIAVTLPQAGSGFFGAGFYVAGFVNIGNGVVTITPTTSTINGNLSIALAKGQSIGVVSDGTNYSATVGAGSTAPGGSSGQVQVNSSGSFAGKSTSGTGTAIASAAAAGTQVSGNIASWDANHNVVDSGVTLGGLGGSQILLAAQAGNATFFPLDAPGTTFGTGLITPAIGDTSCTPFAIPITITIHDLYAQHQTVGSTNSHAFIYANSFDSTNHRNFPSGAPIAIDDTGINFPNFPAQTMHFTFLASNGSVDASGNLRLNANTPYWKCAQDGDVAAKWYAPSSASTQTVMSSMMGGATLLSVIATPLVGVQYQTGGTFGTAPNVSLSTNWVGVTGAYGPVMAVTIVSIP